MGAHGGAVDAQVVREFRLRRKGGRDTPPEAAMAPAVEPVVDRGGRSVSGRAVLPAGTDPQDMNDPADDAPVIHPPRPRLVLRQKRLDRRPSPVRKPKCLIPDFDGAIFSLEWKEALWARFFMAAPQRQR